MRTRSIAGLAALLVVGLALPAQASHLKQVDMMDHFNADVIVNHKTGEVDTTQKSVDQGVGSFITQTAAENLIGCQNTADGLPDGGSFAATVDHPRVLLGYRNSSNGRNAIRFEEPGDETVPVPQGKYKAAHVLATSGEGDTSLSIRLKYVDHPTETRDVVVYDWFDDTPEMGYFLIDDRDRANPQAEDCSNDDAAAIYGFKVPVNREEVLRAIKFVRTSEGGSVLTVYGTTLVKPGQH